MSRVAIGREIAAFAVRSKGGRAGLIAGLVAALSLGAAAIALSAPGDLDSTFGTGGKVTTGIGRFSDDAAQAVAIQSDGKTVVAGQSNGDFALVRYNTGGSLDTALAGTGKVTTDFGPDTQARAVAIQPNGKIVAAGKAEAAGVGGEQPGKWVIARYNPDGSLDTGFAGSGRLKTDFGGGGAQDLAIQENGKMVVIGGANADSADSDLGLARYNPDGTLDKSFSGDGRVTTDFGDGTAQDDGRGIAVQPDGAIIAAGSSNGNFAIARYKPSSGALDTSFSGDGKAKASFGSDFDSSGANDVALQADGAIVAVGDANTDQFAVARFDSSGALDPAFSGDGKLTTNFGGAGVARGVALQGGAIVAVGFAGEDPEADVALARYDSAGNLDTTFSGDGKQTTDLGANDSGNAVATQGGNVLVAAGSRLNASDFVLIRYGATGTVSGGANTVIGSAFAQIGDAVAPLADGRTVLAGSSIDEPGVDDRSFTLARYQADGTLDPTFSGTGKLTTDVSGAGLDDAAHDVAIQSDGSIVAVGDSESNTGEFSQVAVVRYTSAGALDTSFAGTGIKTFDFDTGSGDLGHAVTIQSDGKIVVAGSTAPGGPCFCGTSHMGVARLTASGELDTTFAGTGMTTSPANGDAFDGSGVVVQSNGKILTTGRADGRAGTDDLAVYRFLSSGTADSSFSGNGVAKADFGVQFDHGTDLAVQSNGAIVAVGSTTDADTPAPPCGGTPATDAIAARFTPSGVLDTTFSGDGKVRTDFAGTPDHASGVAIQSNGAIVVAGGAKDDFTLVRYRANGRLDTSLGGTGKVTTSFGGCEMASDLALMASNILLAGTTGPTKFGAGEGLVGRFALARYQR